MHYLKKPLSLCFVVLLLSACGGGNDSPISTPTPPPTATPTPTPTATPTPTPTATPTPSPTPTATPTPTPTTSPEPETGVFIDSPVGNIGYRTETLEGVTNAAGEYEYEVGETVVFFIGDLEFPPVAAAGVVTPLDIAGTTNTNDNRVINIVRLLQTLDTDSDPANGITIGDAAKTAATQVDFDLSEADFAGSSAVITLIQSAGQDTPTTELVDTEMALAHLEGSLEDTGVSFTNPSYIGGTWLMESPDQFIVFAFNPAAGNTYFQIEQEAQPGNGEGLEYGTFSLDEGSGVIEADIIFNENGGSGLDPLETEVIYFFPGAENGELQVTDPEGVLLETFSMLRLASEGILGTWIFTEYSESQEAEELLVFMFLDNGTYVQTELILTDLADDSNGSEIGSYSYDEQTGAISISDIIVDTNGVTGLSQYVGAENLQASVTGNTMTFTFVENNEVESIIFERL